MWILAIKLGNLSRWEKIGDLSPCASRHVGGGGENSNGKRTSGCGSGACGCELPPGREHLQRS